MKTSMDGGLRRRLGRTARGLPWHDLTPEAKTLQKGPIIKERSPPGKWVTP